MNIKKIALSMLLVGSFSIGNMSAIVLQSNDIYNSTDESVTIEVTRAISCVGEQSKVEKHVTTIEPGQTGQVYIMGGSMGSCTSHATELKASASGVMPAVHMNPEAENYTVKLEEVSHPPSMVVYKQLVLE